MKTMYIEKIYDISKYKINIVSGLARGIDAEAHRGSILAGGKTIAVLGNGLDTIYPQENISLAKKILEKAINLGGTTIHTYTSVDGITGRFQQELLVHGRQNEKCPSCDGKIIKIVVNGRGTYYCPKCQK